MGEVGPEAPQALAGVGHQRGADVVRDRPTQLAGGQQLAGHVQAAARHRHELDEAGHVPARPGPGGERADLVVVEAAHRHGVELDAEKARGGGGLEAREHLR